MLTLQVGVLEEDVTPVSAPSLALLLPLPKTMCSSTAGTSCHRCCSSQFLYPVQCHHFINQIRRWHWVILSWLKWLSRSVLLTTVIFWKCQTACQDLAMSWISICWLRIQTLEWRRSYVTAKCKPKDWAAPSDPQILHLAAPQCCGSAQKTHRFSPSSMGFVQLRYNVSDCCSL